MMKIISTRGRTIQAKQDRLRYLEEQFQIRTKALTDEEERAVHRAFEEIRRQLDAVLDSVGGKRGFHA